MNNIMWNYLDKRSATVAALKDYNDMCFISVSQNSKLEVHSNE